MAKAFFTGVYRKKIEAMILIKPKDNSLTNDPQSNIIEVHSKHIKSNKAGILCLHSFLHYLLLLRSNELKSLMNKNDIQI